MNILGQSTVIKYLVEGLKQDKLNPSLLFVGPDGVGKRLTSIQFAKTLFCQNPNLLQTDIEFGGCNECPVCRRIDENNYTDFMFVDRPLQAHLLKEKPESQTAIKIEAIRHIEKFLKLKPLEGKRRLVVVEEADKMTNEAANAFLKILEEPPPYANIILLAVHEKNLLSTIRSRCARLSFRPIASGHISSWLKDKHNLAPDLAEEIADVCGGSFAKALELKEKNFEEEGDLSSFRFDEFIESLSESAWRKEGKRRSESVIQHLLEISRRKLNEGDFSQTERIKHLLFARRQIDRHVSPRLVLENLYLKLEPYIK